MLDIRYVTSSYDSCDVGFDHSGVVLRKMVFIFCGIKYYGIINRIVRDKLYHGIRWDKEWN